MHQKRTFQNFAPARPARCTSIVFLVALLGAILSLPAQAAVYTVGGSPTDCDFTDLHDALAATAANDVPTPTLDEIRLARTGTYRGEYSIVDQVVHLRGGYENCLDRAPSGQTVMLRESDSRHFKITSSSRLGETTLTSLHLTYDGSSIYRQLEGGSIHQSGDTWVNLYDVRVEGGRADLGGGIFLDGGLARIEIFDTWIYENEAIEGGGLACRGRATVALREGTTAFHNRALFGGGAFADARCHFIVSDEKSAWAGIVRNEAAEDGGGLYAREGAFLGIWGNVIENSARRGGGAFVTGEGSEIFSRISTFGSNFAWQTGGGIHLQQQARGQIERSARCVKDLDVCTTMQGNMAGVRGGAVYLDSGSRFRGRQYRFAANVAPAGGVVFAEGDDTWVELRNSDFVGNESDVLIELVEGATLEAEFLTIADNKAFSPDVRWAFHSYPAEVSMINSVYKDDDGRVHDGPIPLMSSRWQCLLVPDPTDWPGGTGDIFYGDPDFVDEAGRDFRPGPNSEAMDLCSYPYIFWDRRGQARPVDIPWRPNTLGWHDAGAYERQVDEDEERNEG